MPAASSPSFIYQHNGTQDDFSNSDRLSTAMIYKAIGMLSSLETIVHHLGAGSAASALASLLRELQDLCIPAKHQQHAAVFPSELAVTSPAATAEPDMSPAAAAEPDDVPPAPIPASLEAVPRCTTCASGVPVAGRFILQKVSLGEFAMPKRCRNCI